MFPSQCSRDREQSNWFRGKQVILLRVEGNKKIFGVVDELGEVISRVELCSNQEILRHQRKAQQGREKQ